MEWLPPAWCPKVVVIDIDGTITDGEKHLSMQAVESIRQLEKAGIPVVLATGNVRPITYGLWRFLGLSARYAAKTVVCSGTFVEGTHASCNSGEARKRCGSTRKSRC